MQILYRFRLEFKDKVGDAPRRNGQVRPNKLAMEKPMSEIGNMAGA
jgi:hypothetical protein